MSIAGATQTTGANESSQSITRPHAARTRLTASKLAGLLLTLLLAWSLTACTGKAVGDPGNSPESGTASGSEGRSVTPVVLLDTSGSVMESDIPALAQNKLTELVTSMQPDTQVVFRGVNSNVTAMCQDAVFTLPRQPNQPLQDQVRQEVLNAVPATVKSYVECSVEQQSGGTEYWGGLAETYELYPDAMVYSYSDTCENVTLKPGTCSAKKLRDKNFPRTVIKQLIGQGLIPQNPASSEITFVGVGRNTKLAAAEVAALRKIAALWGAHAGTRVHFAAK